MEDDDGASKLNDVIRRFSDAEGSLRTIIEAAKTLSTARNELNVSRRDMADAQVKAVQHLEEARRTIAERLDEADRMALSRLDATVAAVEGRLRETQAAILKKFENAEASLDTSQKSLSDVASGIYGLTSEMKDIARDMKDCTIALRSLNPAQIEGHLIKLAIGQRQLQRHLWIVGVLLATVAAAALLLVRLH